MEEKHRDAGNLPAVGFEFPPSEPASSRRRAGGLKRKASQLGAPNSSSTPSKRVTREKSSNLQSPIHNGPLTRARLGPGNVSAGASAYVAGGAAATPSSEKTESTTTIDAPHGEPMKAAEELNKESRLEALKASFEAKFEAVRSRGANAHVVPTHCGWFSWTKIHPIEERTMPSFFDGKSENRNHDTYMLIRNWIMKKFHANPNTQFELKDLLELDAGDLDAKQEVMEFLDHWGLINFHPFPSKDSSYASADDDGAVRESLVEKLYHFESPESPLSIIQRTNITPSVPSGTFPDSTVAEDLVRPEGPAVEYHCNSCSADCSRKRYHCQKQADFDLCSECFNNGKFDSDMSSSDFILMEPAEVPGVSGGKWTDQETLLLLEALELYKENWNEIAEHVATKTKAQCILHFLQMPIEDSFLDCDDDLDFCSKETADPPSTKNELSVALTEEESKTDTKEDLPPTSIAGTGKKEDTSEIKVGQGKSKLEDAGENKVDQQNSKPEDAGQETSQNYALRALIEAFENIGYHPTSESPLSFAEVGNPVMALAAFLARLVGPDLASASTHSSLKAISGNSPSIELAARHCFLLEDPPDDKGEAAKSDSDAVGMVEVGALKDEDLRHGKQKEDGSTSVLDGKALSSDDNRKKVLDSAKMTVTANTESLEKIDLAQEVGLSSLNGPKNPELANDVGTRTLKESDALKSTVEVPPTSVEKLGEGSTVGEPSQPRKALKDVDMSDLRFSDKCQKSITRSPVGETNLSTDVSKDVLQQPGEPSQPKETPKDIDMVSESLAENDEPLCSDAANSISNNGAITGLSDLPHSEKKEPLQPVLSNSVVEAGAGEGKKKDGNKEDHDCTELKDEIQIDKLKCAATTALSAATVKAKLLANQEEDQIRQLAALLVEKQLYKLESKLTFFNEMDNVLTRVREQLDRSKQRLYQERAQIIAARLGLPASSARVTPSLLPSNRVAMNFPNSVPRPQLNMTLQRPPIFRPVGTMAPTSGVFMSSTVAGSSFRPSNQDNLSSVGNK